MLLDNLMNHFIKEKVHIATVYDSFGTFTGIATLEDIIEEIIRVEIIDELDESPDMQHLAAELIQPNILKE
jgi:metal transporter CNNM